MRVLGRALVAVAGALLLSTLAPAALGLSMRSPWAQLVQLRAVTGAGVLVLAVLLGVLAAALRRHRPRWLAGLALVALAVAAGHGGVLVARGALTPLPAVAAAEADLVVVALNAGIAGVPAEDVVDLAVRRRADVLALSEVDQAQARAVADGLERAGRPVQVLCAPREQAPLAEPPGRFSLLPYVPSAVCLLTARTLGPYAAGEAPALRGGAVVARPADGGAGPPLAAVHTLPPIPGAFDMDLWRSETAASVELCAALDGGVVAGDLNATGDHAVLRAAAPCASAADLAGAGARGTWPSSLPPALAAQIDHVLLDPARWTVRGTAVEALAGSDHRAVVAVLRER